MLKSKKEVYANIRQKRRKDGYVSYVADLGSRPLVGGRVRIERTSRMDLVAAIEEFYRTSAVAGASYTSFTKRQAIDARVAFDILAMNNIDLPLSEVARRFVATGGYVSPNIVAGKRLGEAYEEYATSDPTWSERQRQTLSSRLGRFVSFLGAGFAVADMDAKSVGRYLDRFKCVTTRNGTLKYILAFLRWCSAEPRRWYSMDRARGLRILPVAYSEPRYMSPASVEKLLRAAEEAGDRKLLALLCLGFLMGIRFEEIRRLAAGQGVVDADEGSIRIGMPKGWTRGRVPRVVPMLGKAAEWIRVWRLGDAIRGMDARKARDREYALAFGDGVKVPHNAARHTFITMFMAKYNDVGKATTICGTGRTYVARSYMGLVSRREADRFFSIAPNAEMARECLCGGSRPPSPVMDAGAVHP